MQFQKFVIAEEGFFVSLIFLMASVANFMKLLVIISLHTLIHQRMYNWDVQNIYTLFGIFIDR